MNACLANIDADQRPDGYQNNFKETATYAIEVDPVELTQAKRKAVQFKANYQINILVARANCVQGVRLFHNIMCNIQILTMHGNWKEKLKSLSN